jgi:parvulin-like peptidyl-prolyl isomerase/TolA-binding protein
MKKIAFLAAALSLFACQGGRQAKGPVLAKIDGVAYTEGDLDLILETMPEEQRVQLLKDPDQRRKKFNQILRQKLMAKAAQNGPLGKNAKLQKRFEQADRRTATQFLFQIHYSERGELTLSEIEAYYKAHPSQFQDDSGRVEPMSKIMRRVIDSALIAKAPLDSFYQSVLGMYEEKAFCDLSVIQVPNASQAAIALKAIQGGQSFADAAKKFSTSRSKENGGSVGRYTQGVPLWEVGSNFPGDSLLFNQEKPAKPGDVFGPFAKDSDFVLVKVDSCKPKQSPPLASIRQRVSEDWLRTLRENLTGKALERLKAKYSVKLISSERAATDEALQAWYESHSEDYVSPESFDLYHIQLGEKPTAAQVKEIEGAKDLETFKTLAGKYSQNSWTQPQQGKIGVVKRDFALPFGIGMLPALFPALDELASGKVASAIENPETRSTHYFWMASKAPGAKKPFERVKALVRSDFAANAKSNIQPQDTLAVGAGGVLVREEDVLFLREEIPPHMQERYTREALVDFLLTWDLALRECISLGFDKLPLLQSMRLESEGVYWQTVYQDSVLSKTYGLEPTVLAKTFRENHSVFTTDSSAQDPAQFAKDIAAYLTLNSRDFEIEYHTYPERYTKDSVITPMKEAKSQIFQNLKATGYERADERVLDGLKQQFKVEIVDKTLLPPVIADPAATYKKAQDLHYDRKLDQALELYNRLRKDFPDREGLQDSVCFGIAQIYIEQERFQQAMAEYRRVEFLYPKSPNEYKAEFMVGFILAEHLKKDSAAVQAFEKMLKAYPNSDLSDDADWMIRNIRSGGALMPVLEGDSGWVEPDSVPKADGNGATPETNTPASKPATNKPANSN